jgi:isoleucyl-tRNA synthetase
LQMQSISQATDLVDVTVKANFRNLGTRYGAQTNTIAEFIKENLSQPQVQQIRDSGEITLSIAGASIKIELADLIITETPRTGWAVASANAATVALDLVLTSELKGMGLAREAIRFIQENRKLAGFEVSDRIKINLWSENQELMSALAVHKEEICEEVLAIEFLPTKLNQAPTAKDEELQLSIWLVKSN